MNIIFSRKGFDTHSGGYPSPIFPDGTCYSLPIPGKYNIKKYSELEFEYDSDPIQKICNDLTNNSVKVNGKFKQCDYFDGKFTCHKDPCLIDDYLILGQTGSALGHLQNREVRKDDLFLFYGLFQKVEKTNGKWVYIDKPFHMIYAFMRVENLFLYDKNFTSKDEISKYSFLRKHPHMDDDFIGKYKKSGFFFGKTFRHFNFSTNRVLTDMDDYTKFSNWKLPIDFDFSEYISFIKKVYVKNGNAYLSHRGFGQEFVLNTDNMTQNEKNKTGNFIEYINS